MSTNDDNEFPVLVVAVGDDLATLKVLLATIENIQARRNAKKKSKKPSGCKSG